MTSEPPPELQRDVQRLLGRCMLRLQQYERLMKAILAHHELGGPVHELEVLRDARIEKFSDKSLGQLVKALFDTYVVVEGTEASVLDASKLPADKISLGLRVRMEMTEERRAQTKAAVDELVVMRNDLVHHLVERFDMRSEHGCVAASQHLTQCYDRIDIHFEELRQWAESMDEARAVAASFVQSDVFNDLMVNGIAPDGTFDWPHTGIVRVLREAAEALSEGGWARLDEAERRMAERHPKQVPEKYGCRTWPQVLSESRQFDLQYRVGDDGRRVAWYRERL